jgi:hypothetical protein
MLAVAVEFITLLHRKPPFCIEYVIVVTLIGLKGGWGERVNLQLEWQHIF